MFGFCRIERISRCGTPPKVCVFYAENLEAAKIFLEYLLDPEGGLAILKEKGQPPFVPARISSEEMMKQLPSQLQPMVEVKN
ncbi:MAG: molybdate/tungstate transport system substrate-binding protein [Desulforhopalus sp.]